MKIIVKITSNFKKEAKPLFKRYVSLKTDLANLEKELYLNPTLGTSLGNNTYKIRLKITSKGKGKSGGVRVISYLETELIANLETDVSLTIVNLISIYDKSETEIITDKELKRLIANLR
ncbi:addiction module toxin RelE [Mucilaginibacter sp.]|uniref:addiction module toxin RelE n=1 Tax=Mucilaginibacter sp. TaxID=1882438 RepID=UPI00284BBD48|nr:addiction module toxin RelE [Mucilaginibacter sp.]MDR3694371.1 addiction module toxin RelE [Mucilaginibacter sp.]